MDTLFSRHRNTVVLIAVLFVQLVMLAYQVRRPDSDVPLIREWVSFLVTPPQRLVSGTFRTIANTWSNYIDLRGARRETVNLEDQLSKARIDNLALRDQIREMQRFATLADYAEKTPLKTIAARIIGASASDQSRVIILNKGREDGVRHDMAVITADGVVGKVQRVFEGSSQVLLITDEESGVGALLESSRIHGVLRGQNTYNCSLRYVSNDEKIAVGDRLLSSGEDRVFPKGLPVGTIMQVEPGPDFKKIVVQPAAHMNRLEEVLVVIEGREVVMPALKSDAAPLAAIAPLPADVPVVAGVLAPTGAKPATGTTGAVAPSDRPGIPRGQHPETDADKVRDAFHQKATAAATPAVKKPVASAATGAASATGVPAASGGTGPRRVPAIGAPAATGPRGVTAATAPTGPARPRPNP